MFSLFKKRQTEEAILIEKRIKAAFPKANSFDADARGRILKRVVAASGAIESNTSTVTQNRFIKPGKVLVTVGFVVAFAILSLFSSKAHLPFEVFSTEKALAAIQRPGMITYYRVTGDSKGDDLDKRPSWQAEYWVDYDKQMLKSIHRSRNEKGDFAAILLIRDGKAINMEMRDGVAHGVMESNAPEHFDDPVLNGVRKYRELLRSGEAEVLGEEEIKGIASYKVKIVMAKSPSKDGTTELEIANIRKDNYKPVKITYETWKIQQGKEKKLGSETTTFFEEARLISPKDLGEDVFAIDVPKDINYHISRSFSIDEAKQFKDFDLYYLGEFFDGFEFDGYIQYSKDSGPESSKRPKGLPDSRAGMFYHDSKYAEGVMISIWPMMETDIRNSILVQDQRGSRINLTIDKNPAVLLVEKGRDYCRCSLYFNIDRSTIGISSSGKNEVEERDRVIRAAKNLVKIN